MANQPQDDAFKLPLGYVVPRTHGGNTNVVTRSMEDAEAIQ